MDNEYTLKTNSTFQQGKQAYDNKLYAEAMKWLREAAVAGHVEAQYYLGLCYQFGGDDVADDEEALKWIRKAAENGCTKAQERLGDMYTHGWGVPYNAYEAFQWYLKSGNNKDADELLRVHVMMQ